MIEARLSNADAEPISCHYILDDDGEENGRPIYRRYYMCPRCLAIYNTALYPDTCGKCGQHFNGCELI